MRKRIRTYVLRLASISSLLCGAVAGLTVFAMTLLITVDVLGRYLFNKPTSFCTEVSGYMLAALVFIGLAYTERYDRHIILTFLTDTFPQRIQKGLQVVTTTVSAIFSAWLTWLTLQPVIQDISLGSVSLTGLRTPMWIPESFIPLGLACLTIQLMAKVLCLVSPEALEASV